MKFSKKIYLYLSLLAIALLIFVIYLSRTNGSYVEIIVMPKDANILLNNKQIQSGTLRIEEGVYDINISKNGFANHHEVFKVTSNTKKIITILTPESSEAKAWSNQPEIRKEIEYLGGVKNNQYQEGVLEDNPILYHLPKSDLSAPYKIDYGRSEGGELYLLVQYTTPESRTKALNWIYSLGVDPTNLDIHFDDFINPFPEKLDKGISDE